MGHLISGAFCLARLVVSIRSLPVAIAHTTRVHTGSAVDWSHLLPSAKSKSRSFVDCRGRGTAVHRATLGPIKLAELIKALCGLGTTARTVALPNGPAQ